MPTMPKIAVACMLLLLDAGGGHVNIEDLVRLAASAACVVACGGSDPGTPSGSSGGPPGGSPPAVVAGTSGGPSTNGEPAGASCDPSAPFGTPTPVAGVNTDAYEGDATLSADELEVYYDIFTSDTKSTLRIARRTSTNEPFGALAALDVGGGDVYSPMLSNDDVTLFFSSDTGSGPGLWRATRPSRQATFGAPATVQGIGVHPDGAYLSNDRATLWLIVRDANGKLDIYTSAASGGTFGPAAPVKELNTPATETGPVPTKDGLTLYFGSNRDNAAGSLDVWMATRPTTSAPFGAPAKLDVLNTPADEWPTWLSPDGCRLYLSTNRVGGNYDVYVAQRTR
jgi:hypothetical protein